MLGISQTREPPRLKKTDYSHALCELVASVLQASPVNRPSMDIVLQNAYIENTEESHPIISLVDLVRQYYQWEQSGGQRQSLFNPGGAEAAEFPEEWQEDEWNFSTTANFDKQFSGQNHHNPSKNSAFPAQDTPDSFDSYYLNPPYHTPLTSPGLDSSRTAQTYTENANFATKPLQEDRVQRGGKALQKLFDTEADPYTYEFRNEGDNQGIGPHEAQPRPAAGRVTSDLPLRDATQSSSLTRKELEVIDGNKPKGSVPNIDLANVNTIKANRMNRITGDSSSTDESEDDDYSGFKEPKRATMGWTFGNASVMEQPEEKIKEAKRITKDWTFPASLDTDDSDTDSTPVFREPKRDTRAFVFPQMQPADDDLPAIPKRPALNHAATAPVGEPFLRSESGVIDLDALMMTDAAPKERDIMRVAFNDDKPTVTAPVAPTEAEPMTITTDAISRAEPEAKALYIASSADDESDYTPFEQLSWRKSNDDELQAAIDRELTAKGILDPMNRGIRRHELLKQHKEAQMWLQHNLEENGLEAWRSHGSQNSSDLEDFPGK